jgi:hypothetical protein
MIGSFRKPRFGGALMLAGAMGLGCQPSSNVKPGAPLLLSFSVLAPDGSVVALDGNSGAAAVPPRATFSALFDRLLDPTAIEVLDADGGLTSQTGIATMISAPSVEPTSIVAIYVPNGAPPAESGPQLPDGGGPVLIPGYPPGPRVDITPQLAMPCETMVSIALTASKLRSHDQQLPFKPASSTVESTLTFMTGPLTATIVVPMVDNGDGGTTSTAVPADSVAHVTFNTFVPVDDTTAKIHVTVKQDDVVLADLGTPVPDASDATTWNVAPPAAGWPSGSRVDIEVTADAMDLYGITQGTPVSGSFTVAVTP